MSDIIIIGAGISGLSLAHSLRNSDLDITVLERGSIGAGTTGKSIACFGWYPLYNGIDLKLASRSWDVYSPLIDDGDLSYHRNGLLETATTEAAFDSLAHSVSVLAENDIAAETLHPPAVRDHHVDPAVASAGAAFYPTVGRLDPGEILGYFARAAEGDGVTIRTENEVTDVVADGGRVLGLETTAGQMSADVVVNAAGPWAPNVAEMVGLSLPVVHSRAPISVLETSDNFDLPTVILDDGFYLTGEQSATVLVGHAPQESDEDLSTAAARLAAPGTVEGTGIGSVTESHRIRVAERAPRAVPKLEDATLANEWQGVRCHSPDGRPLVGSTAVDGFYLLAGMSGWGITYGPACGELLADHLVTGSWPPEMEALRPDRGFDD